MFAKSRVFLFAAFSLLAFTGGAFAQITAVSGDVKGADGQPVQKAEISIERKDIKGHYTTKTDKKGHYIYNGLPLGTYKISVMVDGQVKDSMDNVRTKLGDPTDIPFDLKKSAAQSEAAQKAAEAGTLTKDQERGLSKEQLAAIDKRKKENEAAIAKDKALNESFNAGKEAMASKNYDAATQAFAKASEIGPTQPVVWANLAESYTSLASTKTGADQTAALEKGLQAYAKAIELTPNDPAYHNNYALALAKDKKYTEAQAELEKAAQLDPPSAGKYFYNLGAVEQNNGQTDPAGVAFKRAIEADPNYADAQYQYAVYLTSRATTTADGKVIPADGTVQALQKYLELKPDGQFAESAKGLLATFQGGVQTTYTNPDAPKKAPAKKK